MYRSHASVAPSRTDNAYIYTLIPTIQDGLAAITSANELVIVDRNRLVADQTIRCFGTPTGLTGLVAGDDKGQTLCCAGTDGMVATIDVRAQKCVSTFRTDRAVTTLACRDGKIAIGTEVKNQQAIVALWDSRQGKKLWQNAENNDDITTVGFHPTRTNVILAGGDDGLVSLFDSNIAEEDDSLVQVINHGPIHKAGFLGEHRIFALSSDQNLAIHAVSTPGDGEDPEPCLIGDLRPQVPCQYVIDVVQSGEHVVIATGTNIDSSRMDMVKLDHALSLGQVPTLSSVDKITIEPAHGEEVVRAVWIDESSQTIYSAGEDGYIRAFKASDTTSSTPKVVKKSKLKESSGRYKPY